jgi:hypothetical protein
LFLHRRFNKISSANLGALVQPLFWQRQSGSPLQVRITGGVLTHFPLQPLQLHAPELHVPSPQEVQLTPQQFAASATQALLLWKLSMCVPAGQKGWQVLPAWVPPAWQISVPPVGPAGHAAGHTPPLPPQQATVLLGGQLVFPGAWWKPLLQV